MKPIYRVGHIACSIVARVGFNLKVYGRENLIEEGPAIVASNHQSYLDPPMIGCVHRRELYYLARSTLFDQRILGWVLRHVNVIPVDRERGDIAAIKTIIRLIKDGRRMIIFPEGTRSTNGQLQQARSGLGMVIAKTFAPVVPVRVFGTFEALPKTGRLKLLPVSIVVGKPLRFPERDIASRDRELYQKLSDRVMEEIAKLEIPKGSDG
ncbi:MAG: lysophospholipid acyltransferase family protein [Chthoniobacterales bacterium]